MTNSQFSYQLYLNNCAPLEVYIASYGRIKTIPRKYDAMNPRMSLPQIAVH